MDEPFSAVLLSKGVWKQGITAKSTPVDILSINILLLKIKGLSAILIIRV